jgi:hypothetical protein
VRKPQPCAMRNAVFARSWGACDISKSNPVRDSRSSAHQVLEKNPMKLGTQGPTILASVITALSIGCNDPTPMPPPPLPMVDGGTPTDTVTPTDGGVTTTGILCDYDATVMNTSPSVNATSTSRWTCAGGSRVLAANGLPDHAVGTFPNSNNPNTISAQTVAATYTLTPTMGTAATELGGPRGAVGYILNGVKMDPSTGGSCNNAGTTCDLGMMVGPWNMEALGQTSFNFGADTNNAHVQPGGAYHYHGMPEGFITRLGGGPTRMTLIGWAADGFPVYARYGHTVASDASSPLRAMRGSYRFVSTVSATRPAVSMYPLGTFRQDYEYAAGTGDLDECNGRTGVTPEFPRGTYHYYATDTYPFMQRCVRGAVTVRMMMGP